MTGILLTDDDKSFTIDVKYFLGGSLYERKNSDKKVYEF